MTITTLGTPIATGRTAEIYPWGKDHVLKLVRPGFPPYLADQEERGLRVAWQSDIAAPRPVEIIEINGQRGIILQRVDGPTLNQHLDHHLHRMGQIARDFAQLHASIHAVPAAALPSQRERLLNNLQSSPHIPANLKPALLNLLSTLPDDNRLCHEDFHIQNILLGKNGPVIIDWESCTSGQPCADVAQTCVTMRLGVAFMRGFTGFIARLVYNNFEKIYCDEYQRKRPGSLDYLADWIVIRAALRMRDDNPFEFEHLLRIIRWRLQ